MNRSSSLSARIFAQGLLEILEQRQLMSGVSYDPAFANGQGSITVKGDTTMANVIVVDIEPTPAGEMCQVSLSHKGSTAPATVVTLPALVDTYVYAGNKGDTITVTGRNAFVKSNVVIIYGGNGNDVITADSDAYVGAFGAGGNDKIIFKPNLAGTYASHYASGGPGNDTLIAGNGNDALFGDDGNDMLFGGAGWCNLNGGSGADRLYAGSGGAFMDPGLPGSTATAFDKCFGSSGNDVFNLATGYHCTVVSGGDGYDTLQYAQGTKLGTDTVITGIENTYIYSPILNGKG